MKQLEHIHLTPSQVQGLTELLRKLYDQFHVVSVILYGSVARGETDEESDIDPSGSIQECVLLFIASLSGPGYWT
jgi:predicted nucleotidyltransferase